MATERVSKDWQSRGLAGYPTPAILGTLQHYGITTDEAGFRALAKDQYPLAIASVWQSQWKGTGQFARFPLAAAQELWRRLESDRLTPTDYATALMELMRALQNLLQGAADAPVGTMFKKLDELKPRVPADSGKASEGFVEEVFAHFDDNGMRFFDQLPEELAKQGHLDDAQEFADLETFLIPERAGLSRTLIRAASGERDAAVKELEAMAADAQRTLQARMLAVDGLIHVEAYEPAKPIAQKLLDEAEKAEDHHLALALVSRLGHLLEVTNDGAALNALMERQERIHDAHMRAHPDHH